MGDAATQVAGVGGTELVPLAGASVQFYRPGLKVWSESPETLQQVPREVSMALPKYVQSSQSVERQEAPKCLEGGAQFYAPRPMTVGICCANHCGKANEPTGLA